MGLKVNAVRGALAFLRLSALGAVVLGTSASFAVPTTDGDNGVYSDTFTDGVGLFSLVGATVNQTGLVVLTGAPPGIVETKDILPTALSDWKFLYLKGTGALSAEVFANNTWSALTLAASDDPAFTHRASLAAIGAAKPVRFRVTFTPNGPLAPNLDSLKATWSPKTTLQLVATRPDESFCSGESRQWRFPFSVSSVSATGTLVWVELPNGVLNPDFGQDSKLRFISATEGGRINATGASIFIRGTEIRPNTVYWDLGTVRYGTSFPLVVTAQIPNGTLDGTSYTLTARAVASNGGPAIAATAASTVARSAPRLTVDKSLTGVYRIGNEYRAELGSTIGYRVTVTNTYAPTCSAVAQKLVLWDPFDVNTVSQGLDPYAGAPTLLTAGLVPNVAGQDVYTTGPAPAVNPIAIPAEAPFALIDKLAPGESRTFEFQVPLASGANFDGETVTNVAYLDSAYAPHAGLLLDSATFRFGIDYGPNALYAKGENIRGSSAVSGFSNDNAHLNVGYGEYFEYLLYAANDGASVLEKTTLFDKLPTADVDFVNAWAPAGNTIYYNAGGATNAENTPPDYNPATGTLGGTWSTTPTTPVTWVAVAVPRIGSPIIANHNDGAPTSVTAKIGVTVKSSAGCAEKTIRNPGYFHTTASSYKIGSTVTTTAWSNSGTVNAELTDVVVRVPSFAASWATVNPNVKSGSGEVDYTISFTNSLPGAANLTDTATNVVVRVDMPQTSIAGAMRPLDLVGVTTSNGTVDDSGLPEYFEVTYPPIGPGSQVIINVKASAPRGVVNGGTARLLATIRYDDAAPGACPVSPNTAQATATFSVDPKFQIDKRVDFAVAGRNKTLTHTLRMVNIGEGASLNTVAFDQLPDNIVFLDADAPSFGQAIYFSAADVPNLPSSVRANGDWTRELVLTSGLFVAGVIDNGVVTSPIPNPRWIAVLVDDNTLVPPQLPATGAPREIVFRSLIPEDAPLDTLIVNEAIINATGMAPAVSNLVQTLISDDPALEIAGICPGVVAAGENVPFTYSFTNNSTNDDNTAIARIIVPAGLTAAALTVTANGQTHTVTLPNDSVRKVTSTTDASGTTLAWDVTAFLAGSLEPGKTVSMNLEAEVGNVSNGDTIPVYTSGTATNTAGTINVGSVCTLLVENPDLRILKLVSQSEVVQGDTLQYTLVVDNLGRREVTNAIIRESLPVGLTIVPGSVSVSPSTWTIGAPVATGGTDGDNGGAIYEWSLARGNAIDGPGSAVGTVPGLGGPIYIRFRANVVSAAAGSTIRNCANVALGAESDGDQLVDPTSANDRACVNVAVPHPDPTLVKTGPLTVLSGSTYAYTLSYRNLTRQAATNVVVYERLPKVGALAAPSVRFVNTVLPSGAAAWYSVAAYDADVTAHPAFNPSNTTGWTQNPANATWVAFHIADLPGLAPARDITIQVEATNPNTNNVLPAGAEIINCALVTSPGVDGGTGNNQSCVTTFIEGLNVAITKVCDPSGFLPGGRPGDAASFTITVENRGTDAAFGIAVTDVIPSWFALAAVEPAFASAIDGGGTAGNFANPSLQSVQDNVAWTRDGDTWYLGTLNASDTSHYRKVGLFPGQSTTLVFRGTIDIEAAGGFLAMNQATVFSVRVQDSDPAERADVLADNTSGCSFTVQRPDPMVVKSAFTANSNGSVGAGETITYEIGFENIGATTASNVIIQDEIPAGVDFIVGSLTDVPGNAVVEYYSDAVGWGHTSTLEVGQPDPEVLAFRIRFNDFPAPLGGNFEQNEELSFESGDYNGTEWDPKLKAIVASAGASNPVYLSPVVPTNSATVIQWLGLFARGSENGYPAPQIDLLDGEGNVVLADVTLDEGGSRSLADLNPATTPFLQLRATFQSLVAGGGDPYGAVQYLEAPVGTPKNGEVWLTANNLAAGRVNAAPFNAYGDGELLPYGGWAPALWERNGDEWTLVDLDYPGGFEVRSIDYLDASLLIVSHESVEDGLPGFWAFERSGASWSRVTFPENSGPASFLGRFEITEGPNTALCNGVGAPCILLATQPTAGGTVYYARSNGTWVAVPLTPPDEVDCYHYEMNSLGYVSGYCTSFSADTIFTPTGTGWVAQPLPGNTDFLSFKALAADSANMVVLAYNGSNYTAYNFYEIAFGDWGTRILEVGSDTNRIEAFFGQSRRTPYSRFFYTLNGAPKLWAPDGDGVLVSYPLPAPQGSLSITDVEANATGTFKGVVDGLQGVWQSAGGPEDYTFSFLTTGDGAAQWLDWGNDGLLFPEPRYYPYSSVEVYGPSVPPPGYETYPLEGYDLLVRGAGAGLVGGLTFDYSFYSYAPTVWSFPPVDGVLAESALPTPLVQSGRILAGTPEGCLIGEVDFPDGSVQTYTWQKFDGEYLPTQLTDANGFSNLKFVVATPDHRIFGNATDADGNQVVVEFGCATGDWFVTQLPIDGYDTATLVGMKNGLLIGTVGFVADFDYLPGYGINAFWYADSTGNTQLLLREFDGITPLADIGAPGLFPFADQGLVYGNGEDEFGDVHQAFVWTPAFESGNDDFEISALPVPEGSYHSEVTDYDGANRLLGFFWGTGGRSAIIWRRADALAPWTADFEDDVLNGYSGVQFLGTGPDAPIIASNIEDVHAVIESDLVMTTYVEWERLVRMDPNDPLYNAEWIRNAFNQGYAPGYLGSTLRVLSKTTDGYVSAIVEADDFVGYAAPGTFVVSSQTLGLGITRINTDGTATTTYFTPAVNGFAYANSNQMGPVSADGVFTLWADDGVSAGGRYFYNRAYAFIPDPAEATGYRAQSMDYAGDLSAREHLDIISYDEGTTYYLPQPPATLLGNGCWTFAEVDFADPYDVYYGNYPPSTDTNNVSISGSEPSNLRLWGCPVVSEEPAEALASWGVTYRTDTRPSVGFQALVEDVCQRTIENTATVSPSTPQLSTDNDSSTVTTPVETADLAIDLIADASVIATGGDRTFAVDVRITNRGPQVARAATANVTLPPGLDLLLGDTTFDLGDMAPNSEETFVLTLQLATDAANVTYPIAAKVDSATIDCTTDNDTFSVAILSGQHPDLKVTKTGPATVRVGEPFTWVVAWENRGTTVINDVNVTDTLPAGLNNVTLGSGSTGSVSSGEIFWAEQDLELYDILTDSITATVTDCGLIDQSLTNTIAAPLANDANPNDNQAAHTTLVLGPRAAVDVTLVQSQSLVAPGDAVFYTAHFRSTGTTTATGTQIRVQTPFVPVLNSISHNGSNSNGVVTFNLPPLAPGAVGSVTFAAPVTTNATLTADVSGGNICPSPTTAVSTIVATDAPQILKTADVNNACTDDVVTWTILVTNPGTTPLTSVAIADTIAAGMTYVPGTITGAGANAVDPANLTWSIPTIPPGGHHVVSFKTQVTASTGSLVSNSATWTATSGAVTAGTSNAASVRIACDNRVKLTKTLSLSCEDPPRLTVNLTYTNTGTTPLTGLSVSDTYGHLPTAGLSLPGSSLAGNGFVTFYLFDLAPGQTGTVSYSAGLTLDPDDDGTLLTDRATITANGVPPQTSNQAAVPVRVCDDDNVCTTNVCTESGCEYIAIPGCVVGCQSDTECDDTNPCTDDTCFEGDCINTDDDNNTCSGDDLCSTYACAAGACTPTPIDCGDGLDCTVDSCVAGDCSNLATDALCGDGNECNTVTCAPGEPSADPTTGCLVTSDDGSCNDNNPCTIDSCNALTGLCDNAAAVGLDCDDGVECTVGDVCDEGGACVGGTPDDNFCDGLGGQNPCRAGTCDPDAPEANADGCVVSNSPSGTVIQANIPCGENACAVGTGDLVCDGQGSQVSTCDPAYQGVSDIGDDQCLEQELVVYALIDDPQTGALRGSVRCLRSAAGVVSCETEGTDADTGLPLLKIYDELLCPGTLPVVPTP